MGTGRRELDWLREAVTIDFETMPIESRPQFPPLPVGVAIKEGNTKSRYLAFGHPTRNNATWEDARRELARVWESGRPILGHNIGKFDMFVADLFDLPALPWDRIHDTMPALFLLDPRAPDYQLKPSSERLLGVKPDERDELIDWLVERQPVPGKRLTAKGGKNYAGAYVALTPGDLAGRYACGDVDRTLALARYVMPEVACRDMLAAYDRERRLFPIIREIEAQGLRIDHVRLARDLDVYGRLMAKVEAWICKKLGVPDLNIDSGAKLANALLEAGLATREGLGVTATGKTQTNKAALEAGVTDRQLMSVLKYRAQLATCLETFMRPWFATAEESGGLIFAQWHSTRTDHGDSTAGARTGRFSSTPNFMNIPNEFAPLFKCADRPDLPAPPFEIRPLPRVRSYVVPYADGDVLLDRDYSQQEPRILGHYEDGAIRDAYARDPWVDYHDNAKAHLATLGLELPRKEVKIINLALIYGMGLKLMAEKTGRTIDEVKGIKAAILQAYPGLKALYDDMKLRARENKPIRTWGGREYFCEPPQFVDGQVRDFSYKLPNVLIQGSAADCTKEAIIRYYESKPKSERLLLMVHDEIAISAPRRTMHASMERLRVAMESVEFDVPMLSEGEWSAENWDDLLPYDKKGVKVVRTK